MKPMSRSAVSVGDSSPARTSIIVTVASEIVSKICIWSAILVTSTTSVTSGWKRLSVPFGASVSKARVGTLRPLK